MNKSIQPNDPAAQNPLRERAEKMLRTTVADIADMPPEKVQELVHELQVHQTELEIQNEELRNTQVQLAHSLDRYSDLYEFAPVGYLTLDKQGLIMEANLTSAAMLGVERNRLPVRKFSDFVHVASQDAWHLHRRAIFSNRATVGCELNMVTAGGTSATFRLESLAFGDNTGNRVECRTTLADVTERNAAYHALRSLNIDLSESLSDRTDDLGRSVEQLRLLSEAVSHLGEGVLITSDDLEWPGPNIVFVNEAISRMTGYDADELIGQSPRMLQGAATDPEVVQGIKSKLVETGSCIVELVNYRKDGTPYEVELFITSLFNACGKRTHFVSIQRDITDRKALVEALRREHELNSSIVNTSKSVTLVLDAECRILQFNPYLENLTGWRFDEVQGKDWFEMFLPEADRNKIRNLFFQSLSGISAQGNINSILTKDGRRRYIEWFDSPLKDSGGRLIGLLCTGQDVTERRELERHLLEVTAEERRRIGCDLHDGVGQELTGIAMIADSLVIALGRQSRPETTIAEKIKSGIHRALSQIRALSRGMNPVDIDARGLMSALSEMTNQLNEHAGVHCTFQCDQPVLLRDNETATQLYRIVQEATTNSIKHANPTQIAISLSGDAERVVLRIADDGSGIRVDQSPISGMGLRTMAYRASMIKSDLAIQPLPEGGTEVICSVPVNFVQ